MVEKIGSAGTGRHEPSVGQSRKREGAPILEIMARPEARPGIAGTAYDTAWLASLPADGDGKRPRFPHALQWLMDHQYADGSWGGTVRYEHDRILSTLTALVPLAIFGADPESRTAIRTGTRYLWQRGHELATEPIELVAFELLLPAMIQRAQQAGVQVPPHLDIYAKQRAEKMNLIPDGALYSPKVTIVHSLEFLGDRADLDGLKAAQGANGAIGNSPAATAFFYARSKDPRGLAYLERCLDRFGRAQAPVLHPCETFEMLWAAYHLFLAGVPASRLLNSAETDLLRESLRKGGVSLSPSFPIPDADDTAVALIFLNDLGETADPSVLEAFALPEGNFASFQYERHSSVGVSLHVLHALLRMSGYPNQAEAIERLLDYLIAHQVAGLYWLDKWHISPYYATAHALCVMNELPLTQANRIEPLLEQSREWIRRTQNRDGSWGAFGEPTAEETAYALLALVRGSRRPLSEEDRQRCDLASHYLQIAAAKITHAPKNELPSLWIDKCLYTPSLIVRAVIAGALEAYSHIGPANRPE